MTTAITSQLELGRDERVKPPQIHFDLLYKVQAEPKMKLDGLKPLTRGSLPLHAFKSTMETEARFFSPVFVCQQAVHPVTEKAKLNQFFSLYFYKPLHGHLIFNVREHLTLTIQGLVPDLNLATSLH